jgi:uncharacterized membrane protein
MVGLTRALPGIDALFIQAHANSEVSWHQVGGTFLIGGVALLGDALRGQRSVTVPALIGAVYGMNLVVFVLLVASGTRRCSAARSHSSSCSQQCWHSLLPG